MQVHPSVIPAGVFEIVARGLPYLDRRALSEAWYASLHVAERECEVRQQANVTRSEATAAPPISPHMAVEHVASKISETTRAGSAARSSRACALAQGPERAERRRPPLILATLIARTFAPAAQRGAATFDIQHGAARVRVLMRSDGGSLRLIALCKPSLRATVARALDEARFLLAARGVPVSSAQANPVRP